MSRCCDPRAYARFFDERTARKDASRYRRRGPDVMERTVVDLLASRGLEGRSVLEIGGGVGAITLELLRAGAARAVSVELSPAYAEEALALLREHGLEDRVEHRLGDVVSDADVGPADVVVLHKVVCCYPDGASLMRAAATRARRALAVTFPRVAWWTRAAVGVINAVDALRGHAYRAYVHRDADVLGIAMADGLRASYDRRGLFWRTVLLERA